MSAALRTWPLNPHISMSELLGVVTAEALITTLFHLLSFLLLKPPLCPSGPDPHLLLFQGEGHSLAS